MSVALAGSSGDLGSSRVYGGLRHVDLGSVPEGQPRAERPSWQHEPMAQVPPYRSLCEFLAGALSPCRHGVVSGLLLWLRLR